MLLLRILLRNSVMVTIQICLQLLWFIVVITSVTLFLFTFCCEQTTMIIYLFAFIYRRWSSKSIITEEEKFVIVASVYFGWKCIGWTQKLKFTIVDFTWTKLVIRTNIQPNTIWLATSWVYASATYQLSWKYISTRRLLIKLPLYDGRFNFSWMVNCKMRQ